MVRNTLHNVKNLLDILVSVFSNNLEGSKKLSSEQLELLGTSEVFQRNIDSSWVVRTVLSRDRVVSKRHATPQNLSSIEFQNSVDMCLNFFVTP